MNLAPSRAGVASSCFSSWPGLRSLAASLLASHAAQTTSPKIHWLRGGARAVVTVPGDCACELAERDQRGLVRPTGGRGKRRAGGVDLGV